MILLRVCISRRLSTNGVKSMHWRLGVHNSQQEHGCNVVKMLIMFIFYNETNKAPRNPLWCSNRHLIYNKYREIIHLLNHLLSLYMIWNGCIYHMHYDKCLTNILFFLSNHTLTFVIAFNWMKLINLILILSSISIAIVQVFQLTQNICGSTLKDVW